MGGGCGWPGDRTSLSNRGWGFPGWGGGREGGPDVEIVPGCHSSVLGGGQEWESRCGVLKGVRSGAGAPIWGEDEGIAPQFG